MRLVVGRIGRPHGVRGEVTVELRTDTPEERFSPGAVLYPTGSAALPTRIQVAGHRWQGTRLVLRLAGVEDRTAAEALRGVLLEADVDVTATDADEYHDSALIGLSVRDGSGVLGEVAEVLHLPGQDVLAVRRPDDRELLVPFVRTLVPEVDLAAGVVVVDLPEGLTELGEG